MATLKLEFRNGNGYSHERRRICTPCTFPTFSISLSVSSYLQFTRPSFVSTFVGNFEEIQMYTILLYSYFSTHSFCFEINRYKIDKTMQKSRNIMNMCLFHQKQIYNRCKTFTFTKQKLSPLGNPNSFIKLKLFTIQIHESPCIASNSNDEIYIFILNSIQCNYVLP